MFDIFVRRYCGMNADLSFTDMFLNEVDVYDTLPKYKKKGLEFNNVILEDGYKEYLKLHYQELIFEHYQRKSQGAYYTKLSVTERM
jgi:hypothetical protein